MATEEKAPVEWAAERILGVRKARAYAILREIGAHSDLEAWLRQRVLVGLGSGRIGRGCETRQSALADAFFIALAGGAVADAAFLNKRALPTFGFCPFTIPKANLHHSRLPSLHLSI
jgi:hypothetical protein